MIREAVDDFRRFCRDREVNGRKYRRLTRGGVEPCSSSQIKVGDLIYVEKVCCWSKLKPVFTGTKCLWGEYVSLLMNEGT